MSSVLETLKDLWGQTPELVTLIPPERIHLGPPNPGSALPCLGFTGERITLTGRSSESRFVRVSADAVTQAETPQELETLYTAMRQHLEAWSSGPYQALVLREASLTINRSEDSPSRLWTAEITLEWDSVSI